MWLLGLLLYRPARGRLFLFSRSLPVVLTLLIQDPHVLLSLAPLLLVIHPKPCPDEQEAQQAPALPFLPAD